MTDTEQRPSGAEERPSRPDASMDLLNQLRETALDPSYGAAVTEHGGQRRRGRILLPALLVVGLLFGITLGNQWRAAPVIAQERADLIARITAAETTIDDLRARTLELTGEVRDLRLSSGALTASEQALGDTLGVRVGSQRVVGPGVRVTLDDGADADVQGSQVVDTDLRMVANSLWASGAEAIAINGRRLSLRTAIRNAGDAITVDYRSLTHPYVVEAIGDPRALEEGFRRSEGGRWVEGLAQHYGVVWSVGRVDELTLLADPGLGVERARRTR